MREELIYDIYLDLHKDYDALDRGCCLDILAVYGEGPQELCLLKRFWVCLLMVDRAGGYYRYLFKGQREVTQGDSLSPKIFNMVVDPVLHHWVSVVA